MQGVVLGYQDNSQSGVIRGSDGQRHAFGRLDWKDGSLPQAGQLVDFEVDAQGLARDIWPDCLAGGTGTGDAAGDPPRAQSLNPDVPGLNPAPRGCAPRAEVAAVLCIFLGGLGADRFYMGDAAGGFLVLLLVFGSIVGVFALSVPPLLPLLLMLIGLICMVRGILYLVMSKEEFRRKCPGGRR